MTYENKIELIDSEKQPLLDEIYENKQAIEVTDRKLNPEDNGLTPIAALPKVLIKHHLAPYLADNEEKKSSLGALKTTSRHFFGKNPETPCLPKTRSYAKEACCDLPERATHYASYIRNEWNISPQSQYPDGSRRYQDPQRLQRSIVGALVLGLAGILTIPAFILCGIVGCCNDMASTSKNLIRKHNRPTTPEHGFMNWNDKDPPPTQSMT